MHPPGYPRMHRCAVLVGQEFFLPPLWSSHWSKTEKHDHILCSYMLKLDLENSEGVCLRVFSNGTMKVVVENEEVEEAPFI